MVNMRFLRFVIPTSVAAVAAMLSGMSASADVRTWTCEDGGHTLTNRIYYTFDSNSHTWQKLTYQLSGAGTGGKSNWNASFNDGTGTRYYAVNQQDNLDNGTWYTEDFVNFTTPRSRTETWRASAAFDTAGTDNHCASSTIF